MQLSFTEEEYKKVHGEDVFELCPLAQELFIDEEVWRDIDGFEGYYQWSNKLRFRSVDRVVVRKGDNAALNYKGKIKKVRLPKNKACYATIHLSVGCKSFTLFTHRFFASKYIPNPLNKPQVNHIYGNKHDYSPINLEWVTVQENILHAFSTGLNYPCNKEKKFSYKNRGEVSPIYGGKNWKAKLVLDTDTGIYYDCIKDACEARVVNVKRVRSYMDGSRRGYTSFIYA